eukprot:scaffold15337_cov201-Cylindrotheca_fusiformis.AAC.1
MAALRVTGWAKTNSASSAVSHVVGVFLVGLNICTEFKANVLVISEFATSHEIPRGMLGRHPICRW